MKLSKHRVALSSLGLLGMLFLFFPTAPVQAASITPQGVSCGQTCNGGYSWTHTGPTFSTSTVINVYSCGWGTDGYSCDPVGTDDVTFGGSFKDFWSGASYQSGTSTLITSYLAEYDWCTNYSNGYCSGNYTLSPTTAYYDGSAFGGPYAIQTNQ